MGKFLEHNDRSNACSVKLEPESSFDRFIEGFQHGLLGPLGLSSETKQEYASRQNKLRKHEQETAKGNRGNTEGAESLEHFVWRSIFEHQLSAEELRKAFSEAPKNEFKAVPKSDSRRDALEEKFWRVYE